MKYKRIRFKKLLTTHSEEVLYEYVLNSFTFKTPLKLAFLYVLYYKDFYTDKYISSDKEKLFTGLLALGILGFELIMFGCALFFTHWLISLLISFTITYVLFFLITIIINVLKDMADIKLTTQEKREYKLKKLL
jgi:hypothetical protein